MTINLFAPALQGILDCAEDALIANGVAPARVGLTPGLPAWDDCCDGFLYARMVQVFATAGPGGAPFPQQDIRPKCGPNLLAVRVAVGVLRCAAVVDDNGVAPDADTITSEAVTGMLDASILLEALTCCMPTIRGIQTWVLDSWNPLGPDGGCVGGEWQAIIGVGTCPCP